MKDQILGLIEKLPEEWSLIELFEMYENPTQSDECFWAFAHWYKYAGSVVMDEPTRVRTPNFYKISSTECGNDFPTVLLKDISSKKEMLAKYAKQTIRSRNDMGSLDANKIKFFCKKDGEVFLLN